MSDKLIIKVICNLRLCRPDNLICKYCGRVVFRYRKRETKEVFPL